MELFLNKMNIKRNKISKCWKTEEIFAVWLELTRSKCYN